MRHLIYLLPFYMLACFKNAKAQDLLLFVNADERLQNKEIGGPVCRAFADINGDYRDDIIRLNKSNQLYIDLSSDNGEKFVNYYVDKFNGNAWTMGIADLDNDGINEIITAGAYNGMKIWSANGKTAQFSQSFSSTADFFAQGSCVADINRDSYSDILICNDEGLNKLFINNGELGFTDNPDIIDFTTSIASDNSGNYAAEWSDVDGDGDLDLYIAKCRIGVEDFSDPRRINLLYINNNGSFEEQGQKFGLDIGAQSWTANFGDIDNDGDMDLFVSNHDFRSMLLENIENDSFREIEIFEDGTDFTNYTYQSAFWDFNNDGLLDILVGGQKDYILRNKGNKHFEKLEFPFGLTDIYSFAIGDANNDGFADVLSSRNSIGSTQFTSDRLWLNLGNENHYIKIALRGMNCNANGIGTRVEIYAGDLQQTRILQSGISYGITNSLNVFAGLDEFTTIDSLILKWPSGHSDVYYNIEADKHYLAVEDTCLEELIIIEADNDLLDCLNDSSLLFSSDGQELNWNSEIIDTSIEINSQGIYFAELEKSESCIVPSQSIVIDSLRLPDVPVLNMESSISLCARDTFSLSIINGVESEWSTGSLNAGITISEPGVYFASSYNYCDTVQSIPITLDYIDPENFFRDSIIYIVEGQDVFLDPGLKEISWFSDSLGQNEISKASILELEELISDTSLYFSFNISQSAPVYLGGELTSNLDQGNTTLLEPLSASLEFGVVESLIFESLKVVSQRDGNRRIIIRNTNDNEVVFTKDYFVPEGEHALDINQEISAGSYTISTDESLNLQEFGLPAPLFEVLNEDIRYPYTIGDLATINSSLLGDAIYPYFFDWKMRKSIEDCRSGIYAFHIRIDMESSLESTDLSRFIVFPNPAQEIIYIKSENKGNLKIYDTSGELIYSSKIEDRNSSHIISEIPAGIYILEFSGAHEILRTLMIKI